MTFRFEISAAMGPVEHDPIEPWDDLQEFAIVLCGLLDDAGVTFSAGGFGDDNWPVDVRFDLSSILPQLPQALDSVRSGADSELDFFEQGIQRAVAISYLGDQAVLTCRSYFTDWKPDPAVETTDWASFGAMVENFAADVAEAAAIAAPELVDAEPLASWRSLRPRPEQP